MTHQIVTTSFEGTEYKFRCSDVAFYVVVYPFDKVVEILAANVECPTPREDGTIAIERSNFNDAFADMEADLFGDDDEDDEDDYEDDGE